MTSIRATQLGLLLALTLLSSPALAGGFELQVHGFYIIDLAILLALGGTFVKGPAKAFLETRYETALHEMTEAMAVKTEAEARLSRYEAALANLDTEVTELNEAFRQDGEGEAQRISEQGEATADKLRRDSAETLAREGTQIRDGIERDVAVQALARAEALIRSRMTDTTHKALIQAFVQDLESRDELGSFAG